ncbi:MAG: sulfur oxidation c-type cytochrome SoxX [Pseudomonadota bacterium]
MRIFWAGCFLLFALAAACQEQSQPLIAASIIEGDGIERALSPIQGDPMRGDALFVSRDGGHCVLCHVLDTIDAPFQGNLGPDLSGVGDRLTPAQLRLRIAQPSVVWPDTIMPSYYRRDGLNQVAPAYRGEPILTAGEVEDLVAFLAAQRIEVGDENG